MYLEGAPASTVPPPASAPPPAPNPDPAPTPAPTPAPSPFVWSAIDPALGAEKTLEKFKGKDEKEVLGHVARAYANLDKMMGSMVRIPGETATPEEVAAFNRKMGVPESYESAKDMKIIPDGVVWNEEQEKNFATFAKGLGLTSKQYRSVMERYVQQIQVITDQAASQTAEQVQQAHAQLERAWGANKGRNTALAVRVTGDFDSKEGDFKRLLETDLPGIGKLGNHPAYLAWAARVGHAMLEANFIGGEDLTTSTADAERELAALMKNPDYLSKDKNPEEHERLVARSLALRQILTGTV